MTILFAYRGSRPNRGPLPLSLAAGTGALRGSRPRGEEHGGSSERRQLVTKETSNSRVEQQIVREIQHLVSEGRVGKARALLAQLTPEQRESAMISGLVRALSLSMDREAQILQRARLGLGLCTSDMADLVGLEEPHVVALEQGSVEASTSVLDQYARVLGLSLQRFLAGDVESAPAAVLFRSLNAERPSFEDLIEAGASGILGEFLRCTADVSDLEARLRLDADHLGRLLQPHTVKAAQEPRELYRQAEELSLDVRRRLGLGLEPVPSMIELMQDRLGVSLFWVGPDELDRDIDGASTVVPRPAVLINLVGGAECWWRTRMTLAHELCHLLFDLDGMTTATRPFLFSPHRGEITSGARRPSLRLPAKLEQIERRANVFAAYFLAPLEAVKEAVGSRSPTSDEAINAVCKRFAIGRVTAINQITSALRLSKEDRRAMRDRSPSAVLPRQHPDAAARPGLRAGRLQDLVVRALSAGRIGAARARQLLGLSLADPLPRDAALTEEQSAPMHTPEHRARIAAQAYLNEQRDLASCFPAEVTREGDGFRVEVRCSDPRGVTPPAPRGHLILSADLAIIEGPSRVDAASEPDAGD